jgi:hypothetical protein
MRELFQISMRLRMMLMNKTKFLKLRLTGLTVLGSLGLLFGSGCATTSPEPIEPVAVNTLKEACDRAISNPETSAKVLVLLEEITQIMVDRTDYLKTYDERLNDLTSNYATTEDEIRGLIEDYNEYRTNAQDRVMEIAGELRGLVTNEEWQSLEGIRTQQVQSLMDGARWL